ncbi:MAG: hypothetical protein CME24_01165 [Gemmatimonadetes bacterium]|nr:hypothetical protein [Gemmatimonadota bacterium]
MTDTTAIKDTTATLLHHAALQLSAHCDGAISEDGVGFNGSDTKFGNRVAIIPAEDWTDAMAWEVHQMLLKYKRQLAWYGVDYDAIPEPPRPMSLGDPRGEARQKARSIEGVSTRKISLSNDTFIVRFDYDARCVSQVRMIPDAYWSGAHKVWYVPTTSAAAVRAFADSNLFVPTVEAAMILNGVKAEEAVMPEPKKRVLTLEGRKIVFSFEYDADLVYSVKAIPGRQWDSKAKTWSAPLTSGWDAIGVARAWDFEISPEVEAAIDGDVYEQQHREQLSGAHDYEIDIEGLGTVHPVTGDAIELRPFQKAGVAYALETKRCFIADEMGLGKTVQSLAAIQGANAYPMLVVCPASLKMNWEREVRMWLPGKTVHIVDNKVGVKNADVVVINYDILAKQKVPLKGMRFQSLVFDESHYAKTSSAQRTKALKEIAASIPAEGLVLALTGTPVLNRPIELVSQLEILDRIDDFGGSWNFRKKYCDAKHNGYGWDFKGCSNADELNELLRRTCYVRRQKADVLTELPAKGRYTAEVEMGHAAMAAYRAVENDTLVWLADGQRHEQADVLSKITTLKRLAGEGKVEAAIEWIDSFLDSTDRKLVVFAHHISVVDALAAKYGGLRVAGKDSSEARQAAVDTFQSDPDARVIVLNMKAGGVGLTLTAASDVLFVEQGWTPAEHDQAEDRCHRIGQEEHVSAWYLLAEGTIDDDIYALIAKKRLVVDAVTDGDDEAQDSVLNDLVATLIKRTK